MYTVMLGYKVEDNEYGAFYIGKDSVSDLLKAVNEQIKNNHLICNGKKVRIDYKVDGVPDYLYWKMHRILMERIDKLNKDNRSSILPKEEIELEKKIFETIKEYSEKHLIGLIPVEPLKISQN